MEVQQLKWKEAFERDGFLVLRQFVEPAEVAKLKDEYFKIVENAEESELTKIFTTTEEQTSKHDDYFLGSSDKVRFFVEPKAYDKETGKLTKPKELSINKIGHALFETNPTFGRFTSLPQHVKLAKAFLAEPLVAQSMYITKQPLVGGDVSPHQDGTFIFTEPESCTALWWPVDKATIQNSCLWVVPGSHKIDLQTRMKQDANHQLCFDPPVTSIKWPEDSEYIPVEVDPGDVVVINGRLVHKSTENISENSRHAYTIHMVDGVCKWSPENWLQRDTPFPKMDRNSN